jgi:PhnB protein
MHTNTYLTFAGTCKEAFAFYAKALGARIEMISTYGEAPIPPGQLPESMKNQVIHAQLRIGETLVMGSDAPGERYSKAQGMSLALAADTVADAERMFAALSEGGAVSMPIQKTFFATRFGSVTDRFGTPWMVLCDAQA